MYLQGEEDLLKRELVLAVVDVLHAHVPHPGREEARQHAQFRLLPLPRKKVPVELEGLRERREEQEGGARAAYEGPTYDSRHNTQHVHTTHNPYTRHTTHDTHHLLLRVELEHAELLLHDV